MVVIVIVGILAALLLPALGRTQANGQSVKCAANLRQIYVAAQAWSADHGGKIFLCSTPGDRGPWSLDNWTGLLGPYLGYEHGKMRFEDLPAATCPTVPTKFGYGHNYQYLSWIESKTGFEREQWATMAQVAVRPAGLSKTVFLCDVELKTKKTNFGSWHPYVRSPRSVKMGIDDSVPSFRHPGKTCNVLWLDGHVSTEKADGAWMNPDADSGAG